MNSRQHKQVGLRRLNSRRRAALHNSSPQIHLQGGNIHPHQSTPSTFFQRVYALVRKIPRGRVATYGQIARALGAPPSAARTVGWAMRACDDDVPWHRVVNAQGRISLRPTSGYYEQRARLKEEGVKFGHKGKIDLKKYGWS